MINPPLNQIYIYSLEKKVPWIEMPEGVRVFERDYDVKEVWLRESLKRLMRAIG